MSKALSKPKGVGNDVMKMGVGMTVVAVILYVFNDVILQLLQLFVMIVIVPILLCIAVLGVGDGALSFFRWFATTGISDLRKQVDKYTNQFEMGEEAHIDDPPTDKHQRVVMP